MEIGPLFKAAKNKKKAFRRKNDDHHDDLSLENPSQTADRAELPAHNDQQQTRIVEEAEEASANPMSSVVKARQAARSRKRGIGFSNESTTSVAPGSQYDIISAASRELVLSEEDTVNAVDQAAQRFAPQTGQVSDSNNKHMIAFIDSELARLRTGNPLGTGTTHSDSYVQLDPVATSEGSVVTLPNRQPAALGKLQEIDLGPDASLRNIEMTEEATRRLAGGQVNPADDSQAVLQQLGQDGKTRRRKRRRNSDDVKRDQLVEAVLRESKIDMYDEPQQSLVADEDQAADDRIADEFRRQFLDAIQSRNSRRHGNSNNSANKHKINRPDDRPRGPKLGGSRSARAAMRAQDDKNGVKKR